MYFSFSSKSCSHFSSSRLRFQATTPSPLPDRGLSPVVGLSPVAVATTPSQEPDLQGSVYV